MENPSQQFQNGNSILKQNPSIQSVTLNEKYYPRLNISLQVRRTGKPINFLKNLHTMSHTTTMHHQEKKVVHDLQPSPCQNLHPMKKSSRCFVFTCTLQNKSFNGCGYSLSNGVRWKRNPELASSCLGWRVHIEKLLHY